MSVVSTVKIVHTKHDDHIATSGRYVYKQSYCGNDNPLWVSMRFYRFLPIFPPNLYFIILLIESLKFKNVHSVGDVERLEKNRIPLSLLKFE